MYKVAVDHHCFCSWETQELYGMLVDLYFFSFLILIRHLLLLLSPLKMVALIYFIVSEINILIKFR